MARHTALSINRDLIAGLTGGGFAPVATFAFGLPIYATLPGAVLVFFGVRLMLAPKGFFEDLDKGDYADARLDLARDVLVQADHALASLAATVEPIENQEIQDRLLHLHRIASDVLSEVERDPKRLMQVQRLLTYYLPSASRLARGYLALERKRNPQVERVAQTEMMITRLDQVFSDYADRLVMPEVEDLDVELQVLDDALREEELKGA
ncbi:MAG: 5-bromo-4-chloroindolyl phosphate hydrolysis family protein [Pseudomonadota bacterium]